MCENTVLSDSNCGAFGYALVLLAVLLLSLLLLLQLLMLLWQQLRLLSDITLWW